jgi:hypothetical protein
MNGSNPSIVRAIRGPIILITLGLLFALNNFTRYTFDQTWPVLLIIFGLLSIVRRGVESVTSPPPPPPPGPQNPSPGYSQSPNSQAAPPPPSASAKGGFGASAPPRTDAPPPAPSPEGGNQ